MASKSYFTEQVTGLHNGVSTLPDQLRRENQAEEQINFISDISRGLESRNGTEYISSLDFATNVTSNSYITKIDKDTRPITTVTDKTQTFEDDYIVVFTGADDAELGAVEIYDKNGIQQSVSNPNNTYLHTNNPRRDIRTTLIEDYFIVSNASIKTAMTNALSPSGDESKVIVYIKQLQPTATYQIFLGSDKVAEKSLNNVNNPQTLLEDLRDDINNGSSDLDISATYTASIEHGNLIITKNSGSIRGDAFTTVDTYGDTLLGILNGKLSRYSELPPSAPNGTIVNIVGVDAQNEFANYYVKYDSSEHVWNETVAPGISTTIDSSTMPHFIIKTDTTTINPATTLDDGIARGVFQIVEAGDAGLSNQRSASAFTDRLVGDEDSNSTPSFIGSPILDLLFYRNRLIYLSKDSVVMSASNDYFNLFNDSAIRALPTDPIDIFLATNYSVRAKFMEPYQTGVIVFCEDQQFAIHSSDRTLSPVNVRLEQVTQYQTNEDVHPVSIGDHVVFAGSKGNNAVIRRFSTKSGSLIKDAIEMTSHVDTYVPKDIRFMFGISNKNMVFVAPENDLKTLYVYTSYIQNNKLLQESWSKFTFNFDILGAVTFNNEIYFIDKSGNNNTLSKLDLFDHSLEIQVDQYSQSEGEDTAADGSAQFELPYKVEEDDSLIAVSLINDKVTDIHTTVRTEVSYPDSTLDEYAYSSKAKVPELVPYVPDDIELKDSYIPEYNGNYKFLSSANNDFKAYYLSSDSQKRNIISYNSQTQKYEIKGFGDDINFPDFVGDYSSAPDPKILPAKNLTTQVDTNNWKINLNKNGTGEERDTFGIFRGLGRGQLASNYVLLSGSNNLNTSNDWEINASIYFDSSTKPNSPIFTTVDSVAQVSNNYVNLYRLDSTKTAKLQMRLNNVVYNYYIDNLFTDEWHELKINFYYGLIFVYDYNTRLTIYDSPSGTRNEVDRVSISSINLETKDLNIMKEHSFSPTSKGYVSDFKISDVTRNHSLEFVEHTSTSLLGEIPFRYISFQDPAAASSSTQKFSFVGYINNNAMFLDSVIYNEEYTYVELANTANRMYKHFVQSELYWVIVNDNSGDLIAWAHAEPFETIPPATEWVINQPLVGFTLQSTNKDYKSNALELPQHTLSDNFRLTMRADFGTSTESEEIYYSNNFDYQGLFDTGIVTFGRVNGDNYRLGFLPKNSTNHQALKISNPYVLPLVTHTDLNKKLSNFTVHETFPKYTPLVSSSDVLFVPELDPSLTITSSGGGASPVVKEAFKLTSTTSPTFNGNGVYVAEPGLSTWIMTPKASLTTEYKFIKTIVGSGTSEKIQWSIAETPSGGNESTIFTASWDKFTTFVDSETGESEVVENASYPQTYQEIDFASNNCSILLDLSNLIDVGASQLITLTQHTIIKFTNSNKATISLIEMSDGVTVFPLEGGDASNMDSVISVTASSTENYTQVSGEFNTYQSAPSFSQFEFIPYGYEGQSFVVNWGDDTKDTVSASNPATHSYTTAVPTNTYYNDGTEYVYFRNPQLGNTYDGYNKIEIFYNEGVVSVSIDDASVFLSDSINGSIAYTYTLNNTFDGFNYSSNNSFYGKINKADVTATSFVEDGSVPTFNSKITSSKLKYLKLDQIDGNTFNNLFDYRFETVTTPTGTSVEIYNMLDEKDSSKNATLRIDVADAHKPIWTTTSSTVNDRLHYEFDDSTEQEVGATVDSQGSTAGSKVTDSSGNNLHGTMKINDIQSYLSCWADAPSISFYDRIMKFGYPTENLYTLSSYFLKRNGEPVATGRLNLKSLEVSFAEAVNFELEITPEERDSYIKQFTSGVGQISSDTINIVKGTHKFGLNALAKYLTLTLKNNSPFRSRFTALGYEGSFINRSKIR